MPINLSVNGSLIFRPIKADDMCFSEHCSGLVAVKFGTFDRFVHVDWFTVCCYVPLDMCVLRGLKAQSLIDLVLLC